MTTAGGQGFVYLASPHASKRACAARSLSVLSVRVLYECSVFRGDRCDHESATL